jgi:hypothetical protein
MAQRTGRTDLACPRYQCDAVCMVGHRAHGWPRRLGARTVLQILDIDGVVDDPILVQFIASDLAVPFEFVGEQEWRRVTLGDGTDIRPSSAAPENLTGPFLIAEGAHTRCPASERQHWEARHERPIQTSSRVARAVSTKQLRHSALDRYSFASACVLSSANEDAVELVAGRCAMARQAPADCVL